MKTLLPLMLLPIVFSSSAARPQIHVPTLISQAQPSPVQSSSSDLDAASPEMLSLIHALSGRWSIDVKFEPGPEMPTGGQGKGEELWRSLAGGLTVSDEENIQLSQMKIHLLGLIWWDRATKQFQGMECINQSPHACDLKAALQDISIKWDGKQLTIEEQETSPDGKKSLWHETYSEITPASFLQVGESWDPGGGHRKVMTMRATRIPD